MATEDSSYSANEVIRFDTALVNFGEHYNTLNFSFVCPYHGSYMFSVTFNTQTKNEMDIEIMQDNLWLAEAWADNILSDNTFSNHASAFVITECSQGQVVYCRSGIADGQLLAGGERRSMFIGYLLHHF